MNRPVRSGVGALSPGLLFVAPMVAVLGFTSVYPLVYAVAISAFDWNWGTDMAYVGLRNYVRLLTDREFWIVLKNTFVFATFAVLIELALGLLLAVYVDRLKFGAGIIRTLLLTPLMVSGIIVALMSKVLLDSFLGIVNYLLALIGLPTSAFFGSQTAAMPTIVMVDAWWQTAFGFIIILAALQSLPDDPIDAARIDGASEWQVFRFVKLPMLRPVLFTVLIFRSIDTLKVFDIVFGTTGGGPGLATEVVQTLTYRTAYSFLAISKAMTIMVLFSLVILAICLIYMRFERLPDGN